MTAYAHDVVDLFAGPGGWDLGAQALGLDAIGIEFDKTACLTRRAAGLPTIEGDVRAYGPADFYAASGLIASPPCQTFSMAGKGAGRAALDTVLEGIGMMLRGESLPEFSDERTALVLEPLRWVLEAHRMGAPFTWLAFEQVPTVLPVWEAMADVFREEFGYYVATGYVHSEQHGVAQTRKRAVLVAHLDHEVSLPTPTHSKYHTRTPDRLDEGVLPWVSMAEALGWGMDARRSMTVTGGGTATGGAEPFGNGARQGMKRELAAGRWALTANNKLPHASTRSADAPAPTITGGHDYNNRRWLCSAGVTGEGRPRSDELPAPTVTGAGNGYWVDGPEQWRAGVDRDILTEQVESRMNNQSGTEFDLTWPADRPSPTLAGRDLVGMPGANANRFNGSTKSRNDGIRVTVQEAGVLQSFPADFPWQGGTSKQFQQCGNAVPPVMACAILTSIPGLADEKEKEGVA